MNSITRVVWNPHTRELDIRRYGKSAQVVSIANTQEIPNDIQAYMRHCIDVNGIYTRRTALSETSDYVEVCFTDCGMHGGFHIQGILSGGSLPIDADCSKLPAPHLA